MYNIVKRYFNNGIYSSEEVARFVKARKITVEQYEEITGNRYEE
jgi:uncharacterized XkdX family phage protein